MKIIEPKFDIIEETALKFAATYFEAGMSQGLKPRNPKHKTPRLWALNNFEKFIPKAVEVLTEMLSRSDIAEPIKEKIYGALIERVNDPELQSIQPIDTLPDINIQKYFDATPLAPIVINTTNQLDKVVKSGKPKQKLKDKLLGGSVVR